MAMTKCKECGNEISSKADSCPKCGAKVKRTSAFTKFVLVLIVTGVVGSIIGTIQRSGEQAEQAKAEAARRAQLSSEQRTTEDKQRAEARAAKNKAKLEEEVAFQKALILARAVKHDAKDPQSVDFSKAFVTEDGTVALTFRAKNSFGALVINYAVLTKDGKAGVGPEEKIAPLWNKYATNKRGYDVTTAIQSAM